MKLRTVNIDFIFNKWSNDKLTFAEIVGLDIPCGVGLKRIRNIVYGGRSRCRNDFERDICRLFRIKFLELQDVPATIVWVYDNQPTVRVKEITVRRVISYCLHKKRTK